MKDLLRKWNLIGKEIPLQSFCTEEEIMKYKHDIELYEIFKDWWLKERYFLVFFLREEAGLLDRCLGGSVGKVKSLAGLSRYFLHLEKLSSNGSFLNYKSTMRDAIFLNFFCKICLKRMALNCVVKKWPGTGLGIPKSFLTLRENDFSIFVKICSYYETFTEYYIPVKKSINFYTCRYWVDGRTHQELVICSIV